MTRIGVGCAARDIGVVVLAGTLLLVGAGCTPPSKLHVKNDSSVTVHGEGPFNEADVPAGQERGLEWDTTCRTGRLAITDQQTGRELFRDDEITFCPGDTARISKDLAVSFECGDRSREQKDVSDCDR